MGLDSMKCDLNTYRRYCERAAELIKKTKEKAQGVTKMLQRGLPIIDKRIKELLGEIEAKAEKLDTINYSVFKLKLRFGEIVPTLRGIQTELNKLKTIQTDLKNVGLSLTELGNVQHHDLNSVNEEITILAGEIEWLLFLLL